MTDRDPWQDLQRWTMARIALGRTGDALPTERVLDFQLAHAQARDAVRQPLDIRALRCGLGELDAIEVRSLARSREEYLRRPDLGRQLDPELTSEFRHSAYNAAIVLADGLSARAVHENGAALTKCILASKPHWAWAPIVIATQARVALGDAIAEQLGAALVIVLIGERPGLTAADSLGAYVTWRPRPGDTLDSQRNCVSNIRAAGLTIEEAGRRIIALATAASRLQVTGIALKDDEALAALDGGGTRIQGLTGWAGSRDLPSRSYYRPLPFRVSGVKRHGWED